MKTKKIKPKLLSNGLKRKELVEFLKTKALLGSTRLLDEIEFRKRFKSFEAPDPDAA